MIPVEVGSSVGFWFEGLSLRASVAVSPGMNKNERKSMAIVSPVSGSIRSCCSTHSMAGCPRRPGFSYSKWTSTSLVSTFVTVRSTVNGTGVNQVAGDDMGERQPAWRRRDQKRALPADKFERLPLRIRRCRCNSGSRSEKGSGATGHDQRTERLSQRLGDRVGGRPATRMRAARALETPSERARAGRRRRVPEARAETRCRRR